MITFFPKVLKEIPATHVDEETAREANKKLIDKNRTDWDIPGKQTVTTAKTIIDL